MPQGIDSLTPPRDQQALTPTVFFSILKNERLQAIVMALVALAFLIIILWLKFEAYRAWRYTSDIFSFFSVMRETSRGFIGLEFVYGNAFGDHAYWFLVLMSPLYWLFNAQSIYFLLAAAPITYWVSGILLYFTLRHFTHQLTALFLTMSYIIGYHHIFRGLYEDVYGMHPEIVGGFLLVIMTCLLLRRSNDVMIQPGFQYLNVLIGLTFLLCCSLKEEMVLLGLIYWSVAFLCARKIYAARWLLVSVMLLAVDFLLIQYFRTPYNRTNEALLTDLISNLQTRSWYGFLFINEISGKIEWAFWLVIVAAVTLFVLILKKNDQMNSYITALFITGIAKLLLGLLVGDFSLTSWHNFPGIIMCLAAIYLQIGSLPIHLHRHSLRGAAIFFIISIFTFVNYDLDYLRWHIAKNIDSRARISLFSDDFYEIRAMVDPMRVTSIQTYSARSWINFRTNFYPSPSHFSPFEIADYIVLPLGEAEKFWRVNYTPFAVEDIPPTFEIAKHNETFILYQRVEFSDKDWATRKAFAKYDLPQDLPPWPK